MGEEQRNVIGAVAERRQPERHDGKAVEEVFAELAFLDHLLEVSVRGAHETQVERDRTMRAQPLDGTRLQEAQELHLGRGVDLADLVEEQGPAVGGFETAHAALVSAGEGAFLMTEEL